MTTSGPSRLVLAAAMALAAMTLLGGCVGEAIARNAVSKKLTTDHPGFRVVSLEKLRSGHGDGVGDTYRYVIESEQYAGFRIAGQVKLTGRPTYVDHDLVSTDPSSPYSLSDAARRSFMQMFVKEFPGKTYHPNEDIERVTESPVTVRPYLLGGVKGKGDAQEYYLIDLAPHEIASRRDRDVANSALVYHEPRTDRWTVVAADAGVFVAQDKARRARGKGFADPDALMKAVLDAIRSDPDRIADFYDPARFTDDSRTSFPPAEEVRRQLLVTFRYAKLSYDVAKRSEPRRDMSGAESWYVGHVVKDGRRVRDVDMVQRDGRFYIGAMEQSTLLPK